jgi:23S rRNA-/tRNA-specific pseudouridylate synthase
LPRRPSRLRLVALGADAGAPLSRFVATRGSVPEDLARAAILRGGAFLGGRRVRDPEGPVREGDRVEVDLRESSPAELPRILHLDTLVLAVDKPAGVLAQEGRAGGPALPDLCARLLRDRGEPGAALLVHRLDRGTTGVTVLARTKAAQAALLREFREGRAAKEYLALCAGDPPADEMESNLALGADPGVPGKRRPDPRGEPARTRFRVLRRLGAAALIAALGLPLAGDARYGGPRFLTRPDGRRLEVARPLLHALALRVRHPDGHELSLRAPRPADLERALEFLAR